VVRLVLDLLKPYFSLWLVLFLMVLWHLLALSVFYYFFNFILKNQRNKAFVLLSHDIRLVLHRTPPATITKEQFSLYKGIILLLETPLKIELRASKTSFRKSCFKTK
jgi:hypothetical protein